MFVFTDKIDNDENLNLHIVNIRKNVHDEEMLFQVLSTGLDFPGYFGFNWDALYDCLTNLDWLSAKNVVLFHEGLPLINNTNKFSLYLEILHDVSEWWKRYNDKNITIYFPKENEEYIKRLLSHFPPLRF